MARPPASRALVLAPRLPLPARSGGDLRAWQAVRALRARGPVTVVGLGAGGPPPRGFAAADWVAVPAATDDGAGLLGWLREPGGHPSDRWHTPPAVAAVREAVARARPEVAVLESVFLHRYLPLLRELGLRVVLDAHNLEGPLHEALTGGRGDLVSRTFVARLGELESAAFAAADQVWVCSEADRALAARRYPGHAPLHVVPNTVDAAALAGESGRAPHPTVLLVGTLGYPPNAQAAQTLVTEIWPRIVREVPGARLALVGADAPSGLARAAAAAPGAVVLPGGVPDVRPWLREAWLTVVPLAAGGGTRLKVLEALAAGLPVVSTAKGVEGLGLRPGVEYLAAETPAELAAAAVALLGSEPRRRALARDGRARVTADYDHRVAAARIEAALAAL